ncbi:MAG: rod shape-determining protein RodA [Candidatus Omnitrophica bacterium]|nr:rod shape-determining protein RodA [Candidatus Omnitrophota bacterium]MCF7894248.1 rod shape-determining protein RodA [Candidatus Omnitrophota bacterium]
MNFLKRISKEFTGLKTIVLSLVLLNLISIASLYSSLHQQGQFVGGDFFSKQLTWIAFSWIVFIIFNFINYRLYYNLSFIIYTLSIILIGAVYFTGHEAMGAQRWLSIGGFSFQPSELSKLAIIIVMARFFSHPPANNFLKDFFLPFSFVGLSAFIIFSQPDLGTAIMVILIAFAIGLFSKVNKKYFVWVLIAVLIAAPFSWTFLKSYQKKRLTAFVNPNIDPLGSGYTIIQSKIAIGSGQVFGKGFLAGTQNQFNFLPERHTDFIFTVIAEEWGFLGSLFLLFIYWLIIKKIFDRLKKIRDPFAYYLTVGIGIYFFLHVFINIGMTLGIFPVVGLPLLFVSYGGSHLISSFILLGIFFNISRNYK